MFGRAGGDLECFSGEPVARALCPVRTAPRHVVHVLDLCSFLGKPVADFPLFPALSGSVVAKHAWVETIEAGVRGLGLQVNDPDGRPRYGGHACRIGGAQALGRAGFDPYQIALLARWGSAAVFGYIRDSPLAQTSTIARRAVEVWEGADPDRPAKPGRTPVRSEGSAPAMIPEVLAGPSPETNRELEARIASVEAEAWARNRPAADTALEAQRVADAACQTAEERSEPIPGLLVRNTNASRAGVVGRFAVTHLVVPTSLLRPGDSPRTFCGWPFSSCRTLSFDGDLTAGEACDKCLPGLHLKIVTRRRSVAAAVAAALPAELESGGPAHRDRSRAPP